ncbi:MAG: hypothetical protein AAGD25_29260 [Cyanobacteria bacterium P01_F01_bin.150]
MTQNIITVTPSGNGANPSQSQQLPQSSVSGPSVIILALSLISLGYMTTLAIRAKYQGKIEIMFGDDIHVNIEGRPQEKQQNINTEKSGQNY